jgi:hypothetical protein
MIWNIIHQNTYAEPLLPIVHDTIRLEQRPESWQQAWPPVTSTPTSST